MVSDCPGSDAASFVPRLGTLPASRRLERWLGGLGAYQVLVSEGDPRPLDPLGVVAAQEACGLLSWLGSLQARAGCAVEPSPATIHLRQAWRRAEASTQALLERELAASAWSEEMSESVANAMVLISTPAAVLLAVTSANSRSGSPGGNSICLQA